jgi:NTE family protein
MKHDPTRPRKRIKLALQGGGAHGAFTWGVLDRLLRADAFEIEGIVGTSAGAMNAAVLAHGLGHGGADGARAALRDFWEGMGRVAAMLPIQPTPMDRLAGHGSLEYSPMWAMADLMMRVMSPYEFNPANVNPLREHLEKVVDFAALRAAAAPAPALFVCATNVLTGRLRVFARDEITPAAVMASACLPQLFQAVEVGGEYFWDGGYSGNPPIFPLIYMGGAGDILIVQLNPINIPAVPRDARAIADRINTLSFNASLMREMRMIKFVSDLIDRGDLDGAKYQRVRIHTIGNEAALAGLGASSKLNADAAFLHHLFALGEAEAERFLAQHLDAVGVRDTTDLAKVFL